MSTSRYHHGAVRTATLTAARAMLEQTPAHQISLREVARAAGISHAAPYKHFTERSDFLVALAARCMAEFVSEQRAAAAETSDPRDRLIRLGTAYVGYGADHPQAFALIFDPEVSPPGRPPPELATLVDEHTRLLHDAVQTGVRAQLFPPQLAPATIATSLWAQVHGLTQLVILGHVARKHVPDVLSVSIALPFESRGHGADS
ncbi:MAG: TetR/AcrR family transcriptional regulator [Nocardioidaceae bacterium]